MKPLNLLAAVCCVIGGTALITIDHTSHQYGRLLPRGRENDATKPQPASYRSGGLARDRAQPPYRAAHSEADAQRARRTIAEAQYVNLPDRSRLEKSSTPEETETGFTYDEDTNESKVYLGSAQKVGSRQTIMRQQHDPSEINYPYQPRPANPEARKEGERSRRHGLRSLPTDRGMVNDHKGPISSHYAKPGQVMSVAMDNPRSQNLEAQLFREANAPVRRNGYEDPTDASTWKGVGGVKIIPNTKDKTPLRPEVGPPESNPYKYNVYEDEEYEIKPRSKRDRTSRSSSGDSYTVTTKSGRRSRKPDYYQPPPPNYYPNSRRKLRPRTPAGVDDIVSTEATASTPQTTNQTSMGPTQTDLQAYVDAWIVVKDNATDIIWPFIVDMLQGTNSSLVITAAWSVYAHLIPTSYEVSGPFHSGWTALPSQEAAWASSNMSDTDLQALYDINDVLTDLYSTAWDGAYDALNSTGVLDDLNTLEKVIAAYNCSLPADGPTSPNATDPYADFFLSYFSIVPDDELDLNLTKIISDDDVTCYPPSASGTAYPAPSGTGAPAECYFNLNGTFLGAPHRNTTHTSTLTQPTGSILGRALIAH